MDPNNPIVRLCTEGMKAEGEGRPADAAALFMRAWDAAKDNFDRCIAAHYVARHQTTPEETLRWNREALDLADAVGDERVEGFYPSLYLNMGYSCEQVGDLEEAGRYYDMAADRAGKLPDDRYGAVVRGGIEEGHKRIARG